MKAESSWQRSRTQGSHTTGSNLQAVARLEAAGKQPHAGQQLNLDINKFRHTPMKKSLYTLLLLMVLPLALDANPARKVTLTYDAQTQTLSVTILHPVQNTEKHYISEITVLLGDKEIETKTLTKQSTLESETYQTTLPGLSKGNVITVKAKCNQFGNKSGKLTIK